ncbi:choice-of-anchor B family protein [Fodinibius salsisoli]|uniref:Choice-of-anchor B family protein n=1 Tax=Fodinibius salsisoli TaxID=2820877 RepID=A0ABT3PLE9_9BACT|nr:choice-of-anchor B family protein [Fodinibius salsisoli]MCW9706553.1 choice-of-anchor B family protein [Fodinibius salsisoli]
MRRLVSVFLVFFFPLLMNSAIAQTTHSGNTESMMGFARAVEVNDGLVFIGESANAHQPGIVYVYRQSDGNWSQQVQLSAVDGQVGDSFGSALSASGNRLLVGAPEKNNERGGVYLFEQSGDGSWTQTIAMALSDTSKRGSFGSSVVLHENLAFIGAPNEQDDVGAVYVYEQTSEGAWTQKAHIENPDTTAGLSFGSALAVHDNGSDLVIGAPEEQGGAVYVYRNNDGTWTNEATLTSDRVGEGANFGASIELSDNQLLIGAPRNQGGSGIVFVYQQDSGKWTPTGSLVAYDGAPRYGFGSSVALVESTAWIGAPGADSRQGALYQFEQDENGSWSSVTKVSGPERKQGDQFASTLAVNEEVAVAGLTGADFGAGTAAILARGMDKQEWTVQTTLLGEGSSVLDPITGDMVECADGKASIFGCNNVDLLSFMPIDAIGGPRGVRLNDIWGWTDPETGKEYALVGRMDGTSFVDVSNPTNPVYVGTLSLPESAQTSIWRDIKVYKNHAYVVADNAAEHGVQVVDLTKLREFDGEPLILEEDAHYDQVHSVHNIVINTDTGFAYAVGSSGGGNTCGGGLHMINIQEPTNPTFAGCFADPSTGRSGTGYSHDAQCVTYQGPDADHKGDEICFGANETAISIANVADKENPQALSTISYPDYAYVHQGWLTKDHKYFISNDELDELTGNVDRTRSLIWDVTDLDNPQFVKEYLFDNKSSDHNLYIKGDTMYQSNYVSGLQVLDVSNPEEPEKTGFFDTEPFGEDVPGFSGTWSNYPFFDSDIVIMTSSQEGLFVLKKQD